jgi:RNA polymerase sigma factor (sigma-70 family)
MREKRDPRSDEDLMALAGAGDRPALETLFERHHRGLYRFFRRTAGRAPAGGDDPSDLVQEVFLRVMRYAYAFRPEGSFRGWLYRIARNAAADARRAAARRVALVDDAATDRDAQDSGTGPDLERVERVESVERLSAALGRLSDADREVLLLARFEGLSGAELAESLECSPGAARVRLHRALARLRALYLEHEIGNQEENSHALRRVE